MAVGSCGGQVAGDGCMSTQAEARRGQYWDPWLFVLFSSEACSLPEPGTWIMHPPVSAQLGSVGQACVDGTHGLSYML